MITTSALSCAARRAPPLLALTALALLLTACGEAHHYAVDLNGNSRRVDKDGHPLPGEPAPIASGTMARAADGGGQPGDILRGTITLQPDLGVNAEAFDSVFVIVRRDPNQRSTDFVRKINQPRFPLQFQITAADSMMGQVTLSGSYQVIARLDGDGDAKAAVGDVQGEADSAATAGGPAVSIVLNQVLTGDGQPPRPAVSGAPSTSAAPFAPFAGGGAAAPASAAEVTAAEAGPHIDGTVEIDPAFASLAGRGRLFVSVSSPSAQGGMPIAVVPVDAPQFPARFRITTLNIPLQVDNKAAMLSGELKIKARLSMSGNAIAAVGDVECEPQIVKAGGAPVTLRLDRRKEK